MANEGTNMFASGSGGGVMPPPPPTPPAPPAPPKEESAPSGFMGGLRVSLMPSGEEDEAGSDLRRKLVIMFAVLIVETVVIGGLFLFVAKKDADATVARQEMEAELIRVTQQIKESEADTKAMTLFDSRVRATTEILDGHVYWTSLFDYIRSKTKPSVLFTNFSGDQIGGVVTLDAMGPTYRDVAEQIVILRGDPMVEEVVSSSASASINEVGDVLGVTFGLVLKLKPDVWKPNAAWAAVAGDDGPGELPEVPESTPELMETLDEAADEAEL